MKIIEYIALKATKGKHYINDSPMFRLVDIVETIKHYVWLHKIASLEENVDLYEIAEFINKRGPLN